jgi:hypothetical protein
MPREEIDDSSIKELLSFKKQEKGKPDLSLINPYFYEDMAKVMEFGATKYGRNNWKKLQISDINKIIASLERHTQEIKKGNLVDWESKLQHACHIACNAMFLHYAIRNNTLSDILGELDV